MIMCLTVILENLVNLVEESFSHPLLPNKLYNSPLSR